MRELTELLTRAGIAEKHHESVQHYLEVLKNRHEPTFHHVLRVGCLASQMAEYADIPEVTPKMMMWAGLLHDVGKALIPPELLDKTTNFDEADRAAMEPHVMYGWQLLQKVHDYTAHVIVRHHRYGNRPYPEPLPPLSYRLEPKKETIEAAARLLALADYYDALMTRNNDKHGRKFTKDEKRILYYQENSDCVALVKKFEDVGVLRFFE